MDETMLRVVDLFFEKTGKPLKEGDIHIRRQIVSAV